MGVQEQSSVSPLLSQTSEVLPLQSILEQIFWRVSSETTECLRQVRHQNDCLMKSTHYMAFGQICIYLQVNLKLCTFSKHHDNS